MPHNEAVAMNPTTDKEREWKWEVERAVSTLTDVAEIHRNPKLLKAARKMMTQKALALKEAAAAAGAASVGRALMNM